MLLFQCWLFNKKTKRKMPFIFLFFIITRYMHQSKCPCTIETDLTFNQTLHYTTTYLTNTGYLKQQWQHCYSWFFKQWKEIHFHWITTCYWIKVDFSNFLSMKWSSFRSMGNLCVSNEEWVLDQNVQTTEHKLSDHKQMENHLFLQTTSEILFFTQSIQIKFEKEKKEEKKKNLSNHLMFEDFLFVEDFDSDVITCLDITSELDLCKIALP